MKETLNSNGVKIVQKETVIPAGTITFSQREQEMIISPV
jgi:hypothetical protein